MKEKIIIKIPARGIKIIVDGIDEAILLLRQLSEKSEKYRSKAEKIRIANKFFSHSNKGYEPKEEEWYNQ